MLQDQSTWWLVQWCSTAYPLWERDSNRHLTRYCRLALLSTCTHFTMRSLLPHGTDTRQSVVGGWYPAVFSWWRDSNWQLTHRSACTSSDLGMHAMDEETYNAACGPSPWWWVVGALRHSHNGRETPGVRLINVTFAGVIITMIPGAGRLGEWYCGTCTNMVPGSIGQTGSFHSVPSGLSRFAFHPRVVSLCSSC
jgi:hypothetical protein